MHTSVNAKLAVRTALFSLVDYAGLFPPAKLPMREALLEYKQARAGPFSWMLGRLIVPVSRMDEMLAVLTAQDGAKRLELSVIVDAAGDPRNWLASLQSVLGELAKRRRDEARVAIAALEVPLPALATRRETYDAAIGQFSVCARNAGLGDLPSFLEMPLDERWEEQLPTAMFALTRHGLGAKLRCGGMSAQAFPSPAQVAAFTRAAAQERVRFKATAGLHHPVRHYNESAGLRMHGFLNLLAAAALALDGAQLDELERVVAEEDAASFGFDESGLRWKDRHIDTELLQTARRDGLAAYGSCSFSEPVEDLRALGILR